MSTNVVKIVSSNTGEWEVRHAEQLRVDQAVVTTGSIHPKQVSIHLQVGLYDDGPLISLDVGCENSIKSVERLLRLLKGEE